MKAKDLTRNIAVVLREIMGENPHWVLYANTDKQMLSTGSENNNWQVFHAAMLIKAASDSLAVDPKLILNDIEDLMATSEFKNVYSDSKAAASMETF